MGSIPTSGVWVLFSAQPFLWRLRCHLLAAFTLKVFQLSTSGTAPSLGRLFRCARGSLFVPRGPTGRGRRRIVGRREESYVAVDIGSRLIGTASQPLSPQGPSLGSAQLSFPAQSSRHSQARNPAPADRPGAQQTIRDCEGTRRVCGNYSAETTTNTKDKTSNARWKISQTIGKFWPLYKSGNP